MAFSYRDSPSDYKPLQQDQDPDYEYVEKIEQRPWPRLLRGLGPVLLLGAGSFLSLLAVGIFWAAGARLGTYKYGFATELGTFFMKSIPESRNEFGYNSKASADV